MIITCLTGQLRVKIPHVKETVHVGRWRVRTQVFSSPCPWGFCTKSLLVLHQIIPSALGIPAEPSPLHRSLSVWRPLFVSSESKHTSGGWGQVCLCNYTGIISLGLSPVVDGVTCVAAQIELVVRTFANVQIKFFQIKSGWLTPQLNVFWLFFFLGGGTSSIQTSVHLSTILSSV